MAVPRAFGATPAALRLTPREQQVYRVLLGRGPVRRDELDEVTGLPADEAVPVVDRLVEAGLLSCLGGEVAAVTPERLFAALVEGEARRLEQVTEQLDSLRAFLPTLRAHEQQGLAPGGDEVMAVADYGEIVPLLRSLALTANGVLRVLRPDQWRLSSGLEIDTWVRDLLKDGWQSRAIYPARILEEAPEVLARRADAGEQVRLLAEVPARLAIFGTSAVVMHEEWRANTGRVLIVRQPSIVGAVVMLFDHMWDRGLTVPGYDGQVLTDEPLRDRRMLLDQMVRGAKDEQIARALGVSLRTVRRRVADIMVELGAESRFQAGVEAVRRGWL